MHRMRESIRTTCPRDCYDACGILVIKREGEIVRVKGDPDHPVSRGELCGKCAIAYNGARLISDPEVMLNPQEAKQRGLQDGAQVILSNDTGQLPLKVKYSQQVPCGVALVYKGCCPKLDASGANVNILNPGHKTDLAESSCVHAIEVEIIPIVQS